MYTRSGQYQTGKCHISDFHVGAYAWIRHLAGWWRHQHTRWPRRGGSLEAEGVLLERSTVSDRRLWDGLHESLVFAEVWGRTLAQLLLHTQRRLVAQQRNTTGHTDATSYTLYALLVVLKTISFTIWKETGVSYTLVYQAASSLNIFLLTVKQFY